MYDDDFKRGLVIGLASGEVLDNLVLYRGEVKKGDKVKTAVYIVKNTVIDEDIKGVHKIRDIEIDEDIVIKEGREVELELSETITTDEK